MQLEWDEKKRAANLAKHGVDFADAEEFDWDGSIVVRDRRYAYGEDRFWAFGTYRGQMHTISYTERGEAIRLISFRPASRKERRRYGTILA